VQSQTNVLIILGFCGTKPAHIVLFGWTEVRSRPNFLSEKKRNIYIYSGPCQKSNNPDRLQIVSLNFFMSGNDFWWTPVLVQRSSPTIISDSGQFLTKNFCGPTIGCFRKTTTKKLRYGNGTKY